MAKQNNTITIDEVEALFSTIPTAYRQWIESEQHIADSGSRLSFLYGRKVLNFNALKDLKRLVAGGPWKRSHYLEVDGERVFLPLYKEYITTYARNDDDSSDSIAILALDTRSAEAPVVQITAEFDDEYELNEICPSFEQFLSYLTAYDASDPVLEVVEGATAHFAELRAGGFKALAAVEQLMATLETFDEVIASHLSYSRTQLAYCRGMLHLHAGSGDPITDLDYAKEDGEFKSSDKAETKLLTYLADQGRFADAVTLRDHHSFYPHDPTFIAVNGRLKLYENDADAIYREFSYLHKLYLFTDPAKFAAMRDVIAKDDTPAGRKLLEWFGVEKQFELSDEEIADNRAWWQSLDGHLKKEVTKRMFLKSDELTDNQLANAIDLLSVLQLSFWCSAEEFQGIRRCSNITTLDIDRNKNNLLPMLADFTLKSLSYTFCDAEDLAPLAAQTELTSLSLNNNTISDISLLGGLKKLRKLVLNQNNLTVITPLEHCEELTYLDLRNNSVTDLSPLSQLSALKFLKLSDNESLVDLSPLAGLPALKSLEISDTAVSDLSPLIGLKSLEKLKSDLNQEQCAAFAEARPDVKISRW